MRRQSSLGRGVAVALALLGLHTAGSHGFKAGQETPSLAPPEVCESKTINYITHTLPQQCLRTSWTGPAPTATATVETTTTGTVAASQTPEATPLNETQQDPGLEKEKEDTDNQDFATGSFMSFEEWKEMMLRKSGQDPAKLKDRKPHEHKGERDPALANGESDSIGEEGEISLDFDTLSEKVSELTSAPSGDPTPHSSAAAEEQVFYGDDKTQYYRSKDAGKTCKERFSYSSFDAGATVLKTSPGAKNSKAILVENKDSYMLLECRTKNKFVIVELSDDILVDTVVIANFEFFSSMIRKFRVSVSDRYPVKIDKWVELGSFEARNSRDIQPFLVEHPQIYTKYIRIEFLTHYGNEYYCPVSLLRVHGTRMLDSWKEQDSNQDDDNEQIDRPVQDAVIEGNQTQVPPDNFSSSTTEENPPATTYVTEMGLSPWQPVLYYNFSEETCVVWSPTTGDPTPVSSDGDGDQRAPAGRRESAPAQSSQATIVPEPTQQTAPSTPGGASPRSAGSQSQSTSVSSHSAPWVPPQQVGSNNFNNSTTTNSSSKQSTARTDAASDNSSSTPSRNGGSTTPSSTTTSRNRTSTSSSAPSASPTVQESFFKTVTKRLQLLESNTSLSLQYIEEQSRFLQDALLKMEKKQAGRVDSFLDSLNKTVLAELRSVRTQYDQIWQSTVIALETQREQSQREIVALSGRVAVLADEVVFQKRMAILQSVLLLSCLVLVIFSRGGGPTSSSSSYGSFGAGFGSPTQFHIRQDSSPPPVSAVHHRHGHNHHAQHQHYRSDKVLPMTPTSQFSREGTPIIHVDGIEVPFFGDSSPSPPHLKRRRSRTMSEGTGGDGIQEEEELEPSPSLNGSTDGSLREDHRYMSQTEFGGVVTVHQESAKPLSKGRSGLSQLGSVRKPLPALPEDPS